MSENFSRRKVLYVTTETFMNDFVDSLRTSTTLAFKRRYRECDVLLIDDVQFMENKEGLQEEFFHTYNDLKGASKQIVPDLRTAHQSRSRPWKTDCAAAFSPVSSPR